MNAPHVDRHGGKILIDQLCLHGCERVFLVPGESFLAALDGLYATPTIQTVVCRQEGGAAMMAEAYGKLTGRPGVCLVSRGPGAANCAAGVHVAAQDSTPLLMLIGQVPTTVTGREAFQEVDLQQMFTPLAKWVAQVSDVRRLPEYLSQAYHQATAGRPGPVVLLLPEDVLAARAVAVDALPYRAVQAACSAEQAAAAARILGSAQRPLVLVGGPGWDQQTAERLAAFAAQHDLPVAATFRCQDYLDNDHPAYVGHVGIGIDPALAARVREADVVLCIGARLGEMTTAGYTLLQVPTPRQRLIHVHPGAEELGRVYRPELAINASSASFVAALAAVTLTAPASWRAWSTAARSDLGRFQVPVATPGACRLEDVVAWLSRQLPANAIITNGAGNYTAWVHRYHRYRRYGTQLAPRCGSMGYGLPAAVAAKLQHPDRTVVCFAGDGCYLMHGQELATAVQYGANIIVVVVNNAMYGTIRMHQERRYPGRVHGTGLRNPDFAGLAESYGAFGQVVTRSQEFPAAWDRALAAARPALIELRVDPQALTPAESLSAPQAAER